MSSCAHFSDGISKGVKSDLKYPASTPPIPLSGIVGVDRFQPYPHIHEIMSMFYTILSIPHLTVLPRCPSAHAHVSSKDEM